MLGLGGYAAEAPVGSHAQTQGSSPSLAAISGCTGPPAWQALAAAVERGTRAIRGVRIGGCGPGFSGFSGQGQ